MLRIVVPFVAGGSTDALARKIGEKMAASLGQPVIVENRPGSGGTVGAAHVAKAEPDGYTLLMGVTGSNATSPVFNPHVRYDPVKDFEPVSLVSLSPLILAINPTVPAKTVADFVALAKKNSGAMNFGTPGHGTAMHLTGEMFGLATGTSLIHVPYSGAAPMMTELLGARLNATFGDAVVLMPYLKAGKVIPLAVTSRKRHPLLEGVPTVEESGYPAFEALSWQGVFAPANTPPERVALLNKEINAALSSPDVRQYFESQGFLIEPGTPAAFKTFVAQEVDKWRQLVQKWALKPQ